jgi:hypothetical protein
VKRQSHWVLLSSGWGTQRSTAALGRRELRMVGIGRGRLAAKSGSSCWQIRHPDPEAPLGGAFRRLEASQQRLSLLTLQGLNVGAGEGLA